MFEKEIVVDCRGHMMGRLASVVAKELLNGQHLVLVRAEQVNISGSLFRNQIKWAEFKRLKHCTNPKKHGPFHQRAPSRMLFRVIRGMLPHKLARGQAALQRLKVVEGIPEEYETKKRVVIPDALRVTRLKPGRDYCMLGRLAHEVGWKHWALVKELEEKRKARSHAFYLKKKEAKKAWDAAAKELA